jgi:hypothetical protein
MKPDPVKFAAAKKRLLRGLGKIVNDLEQTRNMLEWWNENRKDAPPFDVGGTIVHLKMARELLGIVEREEMIPDPLWDRFQKQAKALAEMDNG